MKRVVIGGGTSNVIAKPECVIGGKKFLKFTAKAYVDTTNNFIRFCQNMVIEKAYTLKLYTIYKSKLFEAAMNIIPIKYIFTT